MTLKANHVFVSTKPQGTDSTRIYGPQWNADLTVSGTADPAQLNANVVQAVVNDTNIQGTIAAQTLTFSWGGTLAASRGGFGADVSASNGVPLFATGVATFTGTNGSGNFARVTSPTFVTPTLGDALATSINKVAVTAPASGSTLTIADGKTLSYSEGSWTPVLAGSTIPGTHTYSQQVGRYTQVGNSVNIWFRVTLTALDGTATGSATITGLPFTSSNVGHPFQGLFGCNPISHQVGYNQFAMVVNANATVITMQEIGDNIATANVLITNLHNTTIITGAVTYRIGT